MHTAPAVRYPVVASRRVARGGWLLWAAGAASLALAWAVSPGNDLLAWLGLSCLLASAAFWRHAVRHAPQGQLAWDRAHWTWQPAAAVSPISGQLGVHLDLQRLLLVRFAPAQGRAGWLWLDRAAAPRSWHALRCAVYGPRPPADAGDGPAVATP